MAERDVVEHVDKILTCVWPDKAGLRPLLVKMRDEITRLRAELEGVRKARWYGMDWGPNSDFILHHSPEKETDDA